MTAACSRVYTERITQKEVMFERRFVLLFCDVKSSTILSLNLCNFFFQKIRNQNCKFNNATLSWFAIFSIGNFFVKCFLRQFLQRYFETFKCTLVPISTPSFSAIKK
uniref:(northern house mosquito) hypothetical protein n=1 Tax=Culex pipiens TaxID=7175 RepID=A0A8D8NNU6_CULPI